MFSTTGEESLGLSPATRLFLVVVAVLVPLCLYLFGKRWQPRRKSTQRVSAVLGVVIVGTCAILFLVAASNGDMSGGGG